MPDIYIKQNDLGVAIEINFIEEDICQINDTIQDAYGVMAQYSYGLKDVINLCGGIPSKQILFIHVDIKSVSYDTLQAIVKTDLYYVHRTINFKLGIVFNDKMVVYKKDSGIGTSLFLTQVKHAKVGNFKKLRTTAVAPDGVDKWDGYYRWARLGYQMNDYSDREDLTNLLRYFTRPIKDLSELVLSDDGYRFWKENGFTWTGDFDIGDNSKSIIHLNKYLLLRNIDFAI